MEKTKLKKPRGYFYPRGFAFHKRRDIRWLLWWGPTSSHSEQRS